MKDIEKYAVFESQGGLGEDEMFELVMKPGWPSTVGTSFRLCPCLCDADVPFDRKSVPGNRPDGSYGQSATFVIE